MFFKKFMVGVLLFCGFNVFTYAETITHNGVIYGTVTSPHTGRVWLDRNLGASQVCTAYNDSACYGDYYQWGRGADGHQNSNSSTRTIQATSINNIGHGDFIKGHNDWASVDSNGSQRHFIWSKFDGSSVCPIGFRVPSITEIRVETLDCDVTNRDTAFSNFLKLPSAGNRGDFDGQMSSEGLGGYIWTNSINTSNAHFINFTQYSAHEYPNNLTGGLSIRCIKDNSTPPPTANAGQDQIVPFGQAVRLGTDVTAGIVSYEWKEGSTVLSTSMSFDKSDFSIGTHTVTLTVIDDHNVSATDSVDVTVSSVTTLQEGVGAYEFVGNSVYPYKYYTFTIGATSKVSIHTIKGQLGEDDINDTDGWLYDENGSILSSVSDFDAGEDNHLKIEKVLQPGTYFIKVFGSNGAMGHYVIGFDAQPYDANLAWGIHIPQKLNVIQGGVVDLPLEIVAQNENAKFKNLMVRSNTAMVGMWLEKGKEAWKLLGHINGGAFDINLTVYDNVTGFSKNVNLTLEPDTIKIDGAMGAGQGNSVIRVTNGGEIAETFKVAFDISGTDISNNLDRVECIVGSTQPITTPGYWHLVDGDKVRAKCISDDEVFNAKLLQLPDDERYLSVKVVTNDASEIVKKNVMKIEPYFFEAALSLTLLSTEAHGSLVRVNDYVQKRDFSSMYYHEVRYFEYGDSITIFGGRWKLKTGNHEILITNIVGKRHRVLDTGKYTYYIATNIYGGLLTSFHVTKDLTKDSTILDVTTEIDGETRFVGKNIGMGVQSSGDFFIDMHRYAEALGDIINLDDEPNIDIYQNIIAGVRGTTFKIETSEGSTKASVYEGIVDILDENITLNTMQEYNSSNTNKQNIQKMTLSEQEKVYLKKTSLYSADSNKSVGSIVVNTNLSLAQYILIGKDTQVNEGTLSQFVNVAEGNYTLRFLPINGYIAPNVINLELNQANLNQEKSVVYLKDTDNDGISNNEDTDDDNDGVLDTNDAFPLNPNESIDTDHDGVGNNADSDDDNDGISDVLEIANGLNPLNPSDARQDNDGDGVSNADEIEAGSDPLDPDDTKKPKRFVPIMMDDMVIMVPLVD